MKFHKISGWYFDPYHGGVIRFINDDGVITGPYGIDEPEKEKLFHADVKEIQIGVSDDLHDNIRRKIGLMGTKKSQKERFISLKVDFSRKTHVDHKPLYECAFDKNIPGIIWEDGNVWYKMIVGENFVGWNSNRKYEKTLKKTKNHL